MPHPFPVIFLVVSLMALLLWVIRRVVIHERDIRKRRATEYGVQDDNAFIAAVGDWVKRAVPFLHLPESEEKQGVACPVFLKNPS